VDTFVELVLSWKILLGIALVGAGPQLLVRLACLAYTPDDDRRRERLRLRSGVKGDRRRLLIGMLGSGVTFSGVGACGA
jgi:hypothetical protein